VSVDAYVPDVGFDRLKLLLKRHPEWVYYIKWLIDKYMPMVSPKVVDWCALADQVAAEIPPECRNVYDSVREMTIVERELLRHGALSWWYTIFYTENR